MRIRRRELSFPFQGEQLLGGVCICDWRFLRDLGICCRLAFEWRCWLLSLLGDEHVLRGLLVNGRRFLGHDEGWVDRKR